MSVTELPTGPAGLLRELPYLKGSYFYAFA